MKVNFLESMPDSGARRANSSPQPLVLQEAALFGEVVASTYTLRNSLRYAILETTAGQQLIKKHFEATQLNFACGNSGSSGSNISLEDKSRNSSSDDIARTPETRLCILPMFEWICLSDEALSKMSIDSLLFNSRKGGEDKEGGDGEIEAEDAGAGASWDCDAATESLLGLVEDSVWKSFEEAGLVTQKQRNTNTRGELVRGKSFSHFGSLPVLKVLLYCLNNCKDMTSLCLFVRFCKMIWRSEN